MSTAQPVTDAAHIASTGPRHSRPRTQPPRHAATVRRSRPFCGRCTLHIGNGTQTRLCGVCCRVAADLPVRLTSRELMRLARLVKRHWGDGKLRSLLFAQNGTPEGYRPALVCRPVDVLRFSYTDAELRAHRRDCEERAELAELYDRAQGARGDARRAVRM